MNRIVVRATLLAGLVAALSVPAHAQGGFALKGGLVFNSSDVEGDRSELGFSDAAGFHLGAEFVLPAGIGVGLSGYTAGSPGAFDPSEGSLIVLADANYFFSLPLLPIAPYAGLHTGLGTFKLSDAREGTARPEVDFGDLGFQLGVRFQPSALIGLDAQYRRVSGSLEGTQDADFETNQFLIGVTIF